MAPTVLLRLALALLLVSCAAWLVPAASAADCPQQVASVLASGDYSNCQRDVKSSAPHAAFWVLTTENADAVRRSDACQATLRALVAVEFDTCVATTSSSATIALVRVTVNKPTLQALTANNAVSTTVRRLRHAVARVLQDSPNDQGTKFNYNYLYGAIAIALVVMLVVCVLSRGGICCFCIPIPLCC